MIFWKLFKKEEGWEKSLCRSYSACWQTCPFRVLYVIPVTPRSVQHGTTNDGAAMANQYVKAWRNWQLKFSGSFCYPRWPQTTGLFTPNSTFKKGGANDLITETRQLLWMSTTADKERQQAFMGHPTKETLWLRQSDQCSLLSSLPVLGSSNQMLIKANWLYHTLIGAHIPFIWCDTH